MPRKTSSPVKKKARKAYDDDDDILVRPSDAFPESSSSGSSSEEDADLELALQLSRANSNPSSISSSKRSHSPVPGPSRAITDDEWNTIISTQKKKIHGMNPSPSSSEKRRRKKENQKAGRKLFLEGLPASTLDPVEFDSLLFQNPGMFLKSMC